MAFSGVSVVLTQRSCRCVRHRAGLKMEAALDNFGVDPSGRVAMDSGLSTGGFTDCLLQRGAARVYGVDVGYGQVAERIRTHERVVVMERTNLRHLDSLPEPVSLVTLDLSFISVLKVSAQLDAGGERGGCLLPSCGVDRALSSRCVDGADS